jgi:thymidylate synthase (FAD)
MDIPHLFPGTKLEIISDDLCTRVLDHGQVTLRNIAGPTPRRNRRFDADDRDPAQAARMSFDQMTEEERSAEEDHKLSRYLMKNWHTSPFEMVEIWLEMKMPIFVARQFVRHRTTSINEVSGRYITLPAEWYIPEVVGGKAPNVKQGQADNLPISVQNWFKSVLDADCRQSYGHYLHAIQKGVAAEHARTLLHLNHYTHWLWKQDLHNMMHFLSLRDHGHAQIEARVYAEACDGHIRGVLPVSMSLYDEYRRRA